MMLCVEDTVDAPGGDPAHTHVHSQGELTCESYGDASLHARGMAAIESARHRLDDVLPPAVRKGVRVVPAVLVERDHGRADHNQHGRRSPGEPHGRGRFKEGDDVLPLVGERAFNPSLLLVLLFRAAQVAQVAQHPARGEAQNVRLRPPQWPAGPSIVHVPWEGGASTPPLEGRAVTVARRGSPRAGGAPQRGAWARRCSKFV